VTDQHHLVPWQDLHDFITRLCTGIGMPENHAAQEADALIWANLRGVDSHGVARLPWYIENTRTGVMNPNPSIEVRVDTPAIALVEADRAFGPIVTNMAADMAVEKARAVGIGWVLIRNHTHQGAMGPYVQRVSNSDMAGLMFACSQPNMAPYGARVAGLNNTPFALGVPAKRHPSLLLDMATSLVALGKVIVARDRGDEIPADWGLDEHGNPTTDPSTLVALMPVAGPKGSGMALLFECMGSIMSSNPLILPVLAGEATLESTTGSAGRMATHNQNSVIAAIDIAHFIDIEQYKAEVDSLIDHLKALPKADGFEEILMPGERAQRCYDERVKTGIPLPSGTIEALRKAADGVGVEFIRGV